MHPGWCAGYRAEAVDRRSPKLSYRLTPRSLKELLLRLQGDLQEVQHGLQAGIQAGLVFVLFEQAQVLLAGAAARADQAAQVEAGRGDAEILLEGVIEERLENAVVAPGEGLGRLAPARLLLKRRLDEVLIPLDVIEDADRLGAVLRRALACEDVQRVVA